MKTDKVEYKDIPLSQIDEDKNQPRQEFGTNTEANRLLNSIKQRGILAPITVCQIASGRFVIVDGHRRFQCAQKLELKSVHCVIWPQLGEGEFEIRRYDLQNNRRWWRPEERADAFYRMKESNKFQSAQEVADLAGVSRSLVSNALLLRDKHTAYKKLLRKSEINESYQVEFMKMYGKLRKVGDKSLNEITKIIIERIQNKVIKNAKDLRLLGKVFIRAAANETAIKRFLGDADMTIEALVSESSLTDIAESAEEMMKKVVTMRSDGTELSPADEEALKHLEEFLKNRH